MADDVVGSARITIDLDESSAVRDAGDAARRIERTLDRADTTVEVDLDVRRFTRALSGLSRVASGVGRSLGGLLAFGGIGIAAAGAASGVGALTAALTPAGGLIAALPAAAAGAAASLGALQLAAFGVGDALEEAFGDDAEKYAEALAKLAPAAQEAVEAVRALRPELSAVQQTVQDAFFTEFAGQVEDAARNLLPLRAQLAGLATEFGEVARAGLDFAASQEAIEPLRTVLESTTEAASHLSTAVRPLAQGFLDLAAAVAGAFGSQLGASIADAGERIGAFMSRIAASGQAVQWVRDAVDVFRQLGAVAANVGAIISGLFRAADGAGGGLLNNLRAITDSFRDFVNSARGQEAIGNIFTTVGTVAAQLGPILSALVTQLGAIAPALTPIFTALGPALTGLINALGPALAAIAPALATVGDALAEGLGTLGPALGPLGSAIGSVLSALAPVLPLVGQLAAAVGQMLAPVLTNLATLFEPIVTALVGALMPVLPQIAQAFTMLAQAMAPLAAGVGQAVSQLLAGLSPVLTTLAGVLVQVATALVPVYTALAEALMPVLPPLIDAFLAIVQALLPLLPAVANLVAAVAPLVALALQLVGPLLRIAAGFASWTAINVVVPIIQGVVTVLGGLINTLASVVTFVVSLPGRIVSGLVSLGTALAGSFQTAVTRTLAVITSFVTNTVQFFRALPGRVVGALSALGVRIAGVFRSAVGRARSAVSSLISAIVRMFSGLPGRIVASLGDIGGRILGKIKSGLPSSVSSILPFADGGLVTSPVVGLVGEAGPELILPLSRPQRMRQLSEEVDLPRLLGWNAGAPAPQGGAGAAPVVHNHWTINEVGDAETTARRVLNRMAFSGI